jgi:hypothetical protein
MADKLERIFEFRVLLAMRDDGAALTPPELARLARLRGQLPVAVPALDDRDPYTFLAEPIRAELVDEAGTHPVSIRNASADGFALVVDEPPPLGYVLAVRVRDLHHATEYTFPARVVSRVLRGQRSISVAFEGAPRRTPLGTHSSGVWGATREPSKRRDRDSA